MDNFLVKLLKLQSEKDFTDYLKTKILEAADQGLSFIYLDNDVISDEDKLKEFCLTYNLSYRNKIELKERFNNIGYATYEPSGQYYYESLGYYIYF